VNCNSFCNINPICNLPCNSNPTCTECNPPYYGLYCLNSTLNGGIIAGIVIAIVVVLVIICTLIYYKRKKYLRQRQIITNTVNDTSINTNPEPAIASPSIQGTLEATASPLIQTQDPVEVVALPLDFQISNNANSDITHEVLQQVEEPPPSYTAAFHEIKNEALELSTLPHPLATNTTAVAATKNFCSNCDWQLAYKAKFCYNCGNSIL